MQPELMGLMMNSNNPLLCECFETEVLEEEGLLDVAVDAEVDVRALREAARAREKRVGVGAEYVQFHTIAMRIKLSLAASGAPRGQRLRNVRCAPTIRTCRLTVCFDPCADPSRTQPQSWAHHGLHS